MTTTQPLPQAPKYRRVYTNGKGGTCRSCREFVAAVRGVVAEPVAPVAGSPKLSWDLYCRSCAAARGLRLPQGDEHFTAVLRDAGHVALVPRRSLVGPTFERARSLSGECGGRYDLDTGDTVVPIERAAQAVESLRGELGLDVACAAGIDLVVKEETDRQFRAQDTAESVGALLYSYQQVGTRWLAPRRRALLDDEMGLGKTVQALSALPWGTDRAPALVVATASARGVWVDEAARWRPDYQVAVLDRRGTFRWPASGEIVVTGYDLLSPEFAPGALPHTHLVADEAQAVKNPKAARTRNFRALSDAVRRAGGSVWLLTGTPLDRHPEDLWHLLRAADLELEAFGSFENFQELYGCTMRMHPCPECGHVRRHSVMQGCHDRTCGRLCSVKSTEHLVWGQPSPEVRERLSRVSLRRTRAEVLPDLPEKRYQDHRVEIERAAGGEVTGLLPRDWEKTLESLLDAPEDLPEFGEFAGARAALAEAKADAALTIAESFEEQDEPLVLFSCHRGPLERFRDRAGWAVIDGATPAKKRKDLADAFQRGDLLGLAGNVLAMGTSLTLTRAAHALFVDEPWSVAQFDQACDRLCRIGQTRGVVVHRLVSGHALDRRVREVLDQKRDVARGSLGDG